jgi:hypothetical protein
MIKTNDTIPVKLKQKPCHIKIAHLSEWHIFLRSLIGAVHKKISDN